MSRDGLQAVVFDYGNVLCAVDRPAMCASLARHSPFPAGEVCRLIWDGELEIAAETGRIDELEHFRRIKSLLQASNGWTFEQFQTEFVVGLTPNPDGLDALRFAAAAGLRTFILSNTSQVHSAHILAQAELVEIPEAHVFSFEVGAMKPDPRIWRTLLEGAKLQARQCLYVDDIPAYCRAAADLGFSTINYRLGEMNLTEMLRERIGIC